MLLLFTESFHNAVINNYEYNIHGTSLQCYFYFMNILVTLRENFFRTMFSEHPYDIIERKHS